MKLHRSHPTETDRARCGTRVTDPSRLVADPARVSCSRCSKLEDEHARRFGLLRYALERSLEDARSWLRGADLATVQLARTLATARQLAQVYRALGLSPDGRPEHLTRADEPASPLEAIRGREPRLEVVDG